MNPFLRSASLILLLQWPFIFLAQAETQLEAAVQSDNRDPANVARDSARHPVETLRFFDIKPYMTVVEIWPGGGWYTEILAPLLHNHGKLYAAHFAEDSPMPYFRTSREQFLKKMAEHPDIYGEVVVTEFSPANKTDIAPAGSADRVVTFRNVHNWYMRGGGDEQVLSAFKAFYRALKPGGMLGVVDHRLAAGRSLDDQEESGYMREDYIIKMAEAAGFKLMDKSDINANPKDTTDHPAGVWTLPPSLRLQDKDRERYEAIGESDRMTLKFVKPIKM